MRKPVITVRLGVPRAAYPCPKPGSRHSLHFVRDFVDVDAAVVSFLLVIAIAALQEGEEWREGCHKHIRGREGRMIPGEGQEGREGALRGSKEAKAWDPAGSGEEG